MAPEQPVLMNNQRYEQAVPLDQLTPHPANPNQGDVGLLCELYDANGFAGAILAQEATGIIIDGETRWRAAKAKGLTTIPVMYVDVDDDRRDRLLAEWNESTRRGRNDEVKLLALLTGLATTPAGLEGAGFDGDDVDSLMARLNQPLHVSGSPTGAAYAETETEEAERENRIGGYVDIKQGGAITEMILVFTVEQRDEAADLMDAIRGLLGDGEARAAELVLFALRAAVPALENDTDALERIAAAYKPAP